MNFSVNTAEGGDVEVVVCIHAPCPAPDVEITGDDCNVLVVTAEGLTTPLSVPLPTGVDPDTARVRWRGKTGRLTFTASPAAKATATLASCIAAAAAATAVDDAALYADFYCNSPPAVPTDPRPLHGVSPPAASATAAMAELLGLRKAPSDAIRAARKELEVMHEHYSPGLIWVGKEAEAGAQISVNAVRGDVVLWLDDGALGATAFVKDGVRRPCGFLQLQQLLADVDELVFEGLRPRLAYLAGLHRRSDAMMAIYPGKGARFAKHIDNTTMDGRRLTVLTYLNPGWKEEQGGALRLFPVRQAGVGVGVGGAAEQVDVLPVAGRVAVFLSAEVAHEVMPTHGAAQRHAVTLWYFDAGEHAAALAAARVMPGATSKPSAQAGATALLRDLLAEEAASGIPETKDGCAALGTRVARLEAGAQQLLAAVLGLPSAAALVESFRGLTPSALRQRRQELRNMGLNQQHHAPDTSSHMTHAR
eukprot:XP_001693780.1 predicted protein [Chlamydomonas reinhardtii]